MNASIIVEQLDALREAHPQAPLVVFVPRAQLGQALGTALARRRGGWVGLRTLIPRHYAQDLARIDVLQSGRREAPVEERLFRAARLLQDVPEDRRSESLPGWHLLAGTISGAIESLREGAVSVQGVRDRADHAASTETLGVIADCYDRYVTELEEEGLYDDADVYRWATARIRAGDAPDVDQTVYAVAGAADLSERASQFLRALRERATAFVRVGIDDRSEPPSETAAAQFSTVSVFDPGTAEVDVDGLPAEKGGQDGRSGGDRFVRTVGARGEVKSVFRDLLQEEVSFGDATIAYTASRPYASLLVGEAERVGIPITLGPGLPAGHTRTGRSLRGLFEWVREDYDPAVLIRMLRSGLLRTDRWMRMESDPANGDNQVSDEPPFLQPHEAATLLAGRSYESGREGLLAGLSAAVTGAQKRRRRVTSQEEKRLERRKLLRSYVEALVDLVPRRGGVREMAQRCRGFLETFGPTDAPTMAEESRTPDEAARGLLYQRLEHLAEMRVSCEARDRRLAAVFEQWLDGQYVQAEAPRPGHVHVLPLESVGYSDRSHLQVVGLDSATFSAPGPENGMLQEADRRAMIDLLVERTPSQSPSDSPRTPAEEALWRAERALGRHRGRTSYYTRIFDVEAGEERDPSSLFLQNERMAAGAGRGIQSEGGTVDDSGPGTPTSNASDSRDDEGVIGLVPPEGAIGLSDGDVWLASYRDGRERRVGADHGSARNRLRTAYPWILDGERAREARASDHYTVHDGLLPAERYPELDLFAGRDRPLSASRLETLAEAPYVYFLKYVLDVRPLDEPALDDEPWFNHLRKGTLLHRIYEHFVRALDGKAPTEEDASLLERIVDEVLDEETEQSAPPSSVVETSARRELWQNAVLFLRSEIERSANFVSESVELGFGFPPHRREPEDFEPAARLEVGGNTLLLRGRIDRVERNRRTGGLAIWDYKTGGASSYDDSDPIQDGKTLQWALYAFALEALTEEVVDESGYFFANVTEMGTRHSSDPGRHREDVDRLLQRLGTLAETGTFPVTPDLTTVSDWKWNGYDRLVKDLRERRRQLQEKANSYPEDRPRPPSF